MTRLRSDLDLAELRRIAEAATPGPWHWAGNTDTGEPYLATWTPGAGRCQVLSIGSEDRSTEGRAAESVREYARDSDIDPEQAVTEWATDAWGQPVQEPRLQFVTDLMCVNAREHVVYEVAPTATRRDDPKVYRADIVGIRHPDAEHIAKASPATVLALLDRIESLEAERDKARRGGRTLGKIVEDQCRAALDATGLHHLVDATGDGDWGAVWENLAELGDRARKAEARLARVTDEEE